MGCLIHNLKYNMQTLPPYRVGRKQSRVILDKNGLEVATFKHGNEDLAAQVCAILNKQQPVRFANRVAFTAEPAVLAQFEAAIIAAGYKPAHNQVEERRPIDNTIATNAQFGFFVYLASDMGSGANWRFRHSEQLERAIDKATALATY